MHPLLLFGALADIAAREFRFKEKMTFEQNFTTQQGTNWQGTIAICL